MAEQAAATADPDERLVRVGPLARLLLRPDFGAFLGAVAVWFAFAYFARSVNWIGDPGSPPAGPTRRRSSGSWRCRSPC